ncbi:MAG TPA: NAD(P)/FAD-dependent oxidoreductase [Casimicrobiaceae bacterium]
MSTASAAADRTGFDVIVIGAGAAGMMCAAVAGRRGRRVLLIEHYDKLGEKIRISGGGRCNFTNLHAGPANYLSANPDFCRSALSRYTPRDFIALIERHRIAWHEKTLGQLFCDRTSLDVIAMLKDECDRAGVAWRMPCAVHAITRQDGGFAVSTSAGPVRGEALVIATGGLTVPKIGATPFGYRIAEQFGLPVVPPRPALVPLAFDPAALARYGDLSGISVEAEVCCNRGRFRDALLFTHRGLSGPAILQISSYWNGGDALSIDLLPGSDAHAWLESERQSPARLDNLLAQRLPRRFAQQWSAAEDAVVPVNRLDDRRRQQLAGLLHAWPVLPSGTLGYNKAEVTLGGVDTRALSSRTMAATRVPRLHFIGEVVDVTGWLGGYNFQWAWSSGYAAGQHA